MYIWTRLSLSCSTSEIRRPSLLPALKPKKKKKKRKDKRNGCFGWVNDRLCMQENIHPFGASVRAGEDSASVVEPAPTNATAASRCFRGAFAYPLVYTFSISSRGSAPQRGCLVYARNCITLVPSPAPSYRRYVVANLRALAI
ncbi:hypothetical protein PUN28_001980 [Cardiocondyla obscurior]|uniref:Uncharacterized protein n=1 Tax=Cardiocondyla obscurior TaxID=286306 RepID=A0AAW2GS90_9HYME